MHIFGIGPDRVLIFTTRVGNRAEYKKVARNTSQISNVQIACIVICQKPRLGKSTLLMVLWECLVLVIKSQINPPVFTIPPARALLIKVEVFFIFFPLFNLSFFVSLSFFFENRHLRPQTGT